MRPERWQKVEQTYNCALERAPAQREAFLKDACSGDESLPEEVEGLLRASGAKEFMVRSINPISHLTADARR